MIQGRLIILRWEQFFWLVDFYHKIWSKSDHFWQCPKLWTLCIILKIRKNSVPNFWYVSRKKITYLTSGPKLVSSWGHWDPFFDWRVISISGAHFAAVFGPRPKLPWSVVGIGQQKSENAHIPVSVFSYNDTIKK